MDIKIGSVVMLKSGGPKMVVVSGTESQVTCLGFGDKQEQICLSVPPDCLILVAE